MAKTISYTIKLSSNNDQFGLIPGNPKDAVLVIDNDAEQLVHHPVKRTSSPYVSKQIESIKTSRGQTVISANTTDLLITDVFDQNGKPLWRKVPIVDRGQTKVLVNGEVPEASDQHFIYTNERVVLISYIDVDSEIIANARSSSYPVFPAEYSAAYQALMAIDDRHFVYTIKSRGMINVSVNRKNIEAAIDDDGLFSAKRVSKDYVGIQPAIHKDFRTIDGKSAVIEYNYASNPFNIIRIYDEYANLTPELCLFTSLPEIIPSSIKIEIKNIYTDQVVHTINAVDIQLDMIDMSFGKIKLPALPSSIDALSSELGFFISYSAIFNNRLYVSIEDRGIKKDCQMSFFVTPSMVRYDGQEVASDPRLTRLVIDSSNRYEYTDNPYLHPGITHASDAGGHFISFNTSLENYKANYSFSNSMVQDKYRFTLNEIQRVRCLSYNNVSAWLDAGTINASLDLSALNIIPNLYEAKVKTDLVPFKEMKRFTSSLAHASLDGQYSETVLAAGVHKSQMIAGIRFEGSVASHGTNTATIVFDTKKLLFLFNPNGSVKDLVVQDGSVLQYVNKKLDRSKYNFGANLLNLRAYTIGQDGVIEPILNDVKLSSDLKLAFVTVDPAIVNNVGLGYSHQDNTLLPEVFVKL